jgi:polyisoprenoid-binding protein YceI
MMASTYGDAMKKTNASSNPLTLRMRTVRLARCAALLIAIVSTMCAAARAQQVQVTLDPAHTKINISVNDVHGGVKGTFAMKTGAVTFDPATGTASGEIVVDANSGQTGIDRRDRKMKNEILETERYPEISFTATKVTGQVAPQGSSTVQVVGDFHIHGASHSLTLSVPVQVAGDKLTGTTSFTVPYESWGMKNPSVLFLHVDGNAEVTVSFEGKITLPGAGR